MIVFRYFTREILTLLVAICGILLIITTVSQLSFYLSRVAQGLLAFHLLSKILLVNMPILLSLLLPFSFYLAILLAYSRLYADSEMTVLLASGLSQAKLVGYTFLLGILLTAVTGYLIIVAGPELVKKRGELTANGNQFIIQSIVPCQFHVSSDGNQIIYVGSVSRDRNTLNDIFIGQYSPPSGDSPASWEVSFSKTATQVMENNYPYLKAESGYAYSGNPGNLDYKVISYDAYEARLMAPKTTTKYHRLDGTSSLELFQGREDVMKLSELEWRISLTIQILILTLLAVPLSKVNPRQGKYAKFLPALAFYTLYAVLLSLARVLLENKHVPMSIGLWWVHGVMLLIALSLYFPIIKRR
jgi:lipopolysaccharide export system permease protein